MEHVDEDHAIAEVIDRLAIRFDAIPRAEIDSVVRAEHAKLLGNPIRDYVPVLVEHAAKARLRTVA